MNMPQTEIYSKLTGIFHDVFDDSAIALAPHTCAADISGWDSFNHINLVIAIESAFSVKFNTTELERMNCVDDIVSLIQQKSSLN